jgi:hypothetical protein
MSKRTTAQIQKQSNTNRSYENVAVKSIWDANSRHLRHQNSFSGISYLDVIKERERSDSGFSGDGFSGDVYEDFTNDTSFLKNIPEGNNCTSIDDTEYEDGRVERENPSNESTSTRTPAFPMVSSNKNVNSRRESYDSGLSVSPPAQTPPQFHIELESSDSKNDCQIAHSTESNDNTGCGEARVNEATPPARRRKKKKRLCGSLSVTQFCDVYRLTGQILGEGSYGKVEGCQNIMTNAEYAVKLISKRHVHFSRPKVNFDQVNSFILSELLRFMYHITFKSI